MTVRDRRGRQGAGGSGPGAELRLDAVEEDVESELERRVEVVVAEIRVAGQRRMPLRGAVEVLLGPPAQVRLGRRLVTQAPPGVLHGGVALDVVRQGPDRCGEPRPVQAGAPEQGVDQFGAGERVRAEERTGGYQGGQPGCRSMT